MSGDIKNMAETQNQKPLEASPIVEGPVSEERQMASPDAKLIAGEVLAFVRRQGIVLTGEQERAVVDGFVERYRYQGVQSVSGAEITPNPEDASAEQNAQPNAATETSPTPVSSSPEPTQNEEPVQPVASAEGGQDVVEAVTVPEPEGNPEAEKSELEKTWDEFGVHFKNIMQKDGRWSEEAVNAFYDALKTGVLKHDSEDPEALVIFENLPKTDDYSLRTTLDHQLNQHLLGEYIEKIPEGGLLKNEGGDSISSKVASDLLRQAAKEYWFATSQTEGVSLLRKMKSEIGADPENLKDKFRMAIVGQIEGSLKKMPLDDQRYENADVLASFILAEFENSKTSFDEAIMKYVKEGDSEREVPVGKSVEHLERIEGLPGGVTVNEVLDLLGVEYPTTLQFEVSSLVSDVVDPDIHVKGNGSPSLVKVGEIPVNDQKILVLATKPGQYFRDTDPIGEGSAKTQVYLAPVDASGRLVEFDSR